MAAQICSSEGFNMLSLKLMAKRIPDDPLDRPNSFLAYLTNVLFFGMFTIYLLYLLPSSESLFGLIFLVILVMITVCATAWAAYGCIKSITQQGES